MTKTRTSLAFSDTNKNTSFHSREKLFNSEIQVLSTLVSYKCNIVPLPTQTPHPSPQNPSPYQVTVIQRFGLIAVCHKKNTGKPICWDFNTILAASKFNSSIVYFTKCYKLPVRHLLMRCGWHHKLLPCDISR